MKSKSATINWTKKELALFKQIANSSSSSNLHARRILRKSAEFRPSGFQSNPEAGI